MSIHREVNAIERTGQLNLRIADSELAMLRALADDRGLSSSDVVRTMIRDAYRARFGETAPKKQKSKK